MMKFLSFSRVVHSDSW